eukprot:scaffold100843_cov19-Prasinocladus_malaysianus.AAC.1
MDMRLQLEFTIKPVRLSDSYPAGTKLARRDRNLPIHVSRTGTHFQSTWQGVLILTLLSAGRRPKGAHRRPKESHTNFTSKRYNG